MCLTVTIRESVPVKRMLKGKNVTGVSLDTLTYNSPMNKVAFHVSVMAILMYAPAHRVIRCIESKVHLTEIRNDGLPKIKMEMKYLCSIIVATRTW